MSVCGDVIRVSFNSVSTISSFIIEASEVKLVSMDRVFNEEESVERKFRNFQIKTHFFWKKPQNLVAKMCTRLISNALSLQ